jgi:hypothetical protein
MTSMVINVTKNRGRNEAWLLLGSVIGTGQGQGCDERCTVNSEESTLGPGTELTQKGRLESSLSSEAVPSVTHGQGFREGNARCVR